MPSFTVSAEARDARDAVEREASLKGWPGSVSKGLLGAFAALEGTEPRDKVALSAVVTETEAHFHASNLDVGTSHPHGADAPPAAAGNAAALRNAAREDGDEAAAAAYAAERAVAALERIADATAEHAAA